MNYTLTLFGKKYRCNASAFWLVALAIIAFLCVLVYGLFGLSTYLFGTSFPVVLFIVSVIQVTANGKIYSIIPHRWLESKAMKYVYYALGIASIAYLLFM